MNSDNQIGRRGALALIGGGAAALAAAPILPAQAKPASSKIDFSTPEGRLRAYMLMRGALDDRVVIGYVTGQYYADIDAELTPLFGVIGATFARYRPLASGGYECATGEQAYFTDLQTGKWMKTFKNPYTGETVEVPTGGYKPNKIIFTPDLDLKLSATLPGVQFDHVINPPEARGDDVWITETTYTSSTPPGAEKPFRYSESIVLHARRSELEARNVKRVRCETTFNGVVSWRPWLKMGDRPGHLLAVGAGRYGATLDTMPQAWIEAVSEHRPELLKNPGAMLDPVWNATS